MDGYEALLAERELFHGPGGASSWVDQSRAGDVDRDLPGRLLVAYGHTYDPDGDEKEEERTVGMVGGTWVSWRWLNGLANGGWLRGEAMDMMMRVLHGEVGGTFHGSGIQPSECSPGRVFLCACYVYSSATPVRVLLHHSTKAGRRDKFLEDYDLVVMPVNIDKVHWILAVIDIKERCIRTCDSLGVRRFGVVQKIRGFVLGLYTECGKTEQDFKRDIWRHVPHSVPQQANGDDCGVFTLMFAAAFAKGTDGRGAYPGLQFAASEVPTIRAWMLQTIFAQMAECGSVADISLAGF
jgi:hypothetical protein